jgi:hypothetical protein
MKPYFNLSKNSKKGSPNFILDKEEFFICSIGKIHRLFLKSGLSSRGCLFKKIPEGRAFILKASVKIRVQKICGQSTRFNVWQQILANL